MSGGSLHSGVSVQGVSVQWISVQGVLYTGGSVSRGVLCQGDHLCGKGSGHTYPTVMHSCFHLISLLLVFLLDIIFINY